MKNQTEKNVEMEEQEILFVKNPIKTKTKKLTNLQILELHMKLSTLRTVNGIKLNHAISRTITFLKDLVEEYGRDKKIPVLDDYKAYEKELQEAYKDLSKNKEGNPTSKILRNERNQEYEEINFNINSQEAIDVRAKIQAKHKKAIEKRIKQAELYNEWLREESEDEYRLFYIPESVILSDNELGKDVWDAISPLVKEVTPEQEKEWDNLFEKLK